MHELSIANSILDTVRAEAARRPGTRLTKVGLRVGELAGVDPESLDFCFNVLVSGTEFAPLALEIETRPRRQHCPRCDQAFEVSDFDISCPECGNLETKCVGGDELEVAYLELEEP